MAKNHQKQSNQQIKHNYSKEINKHQNKQNKTKQNKTKQNKTNKQTNKQTNKNSSGSSFHTTWGDGRLNYVELLRGFYVRAGHGARALLEDVWFEKHG